jgi:hypothetical protein
LDKSKTAKSIRDFTPIAERFKELSSYPYGGATEVKELNDKMGIGDNRHQSHLFNNHFLELKKGDMIYLFTDGFPDQIEEPKRKKFCYPPFRELLLQISALDPKIQKEKLNEAHQWMGEKMDQTDDILILGIRIKRVN